VAAGAAPAAAFSERVLELVRALRATGVPVAVSDGLDAQRASAVVDLLDRAQLREALAATVVKTPTHRPAFDVLFDLYFPPRPGAGGADSEDGRLRDPAGRPIEGFLAELIRALRADDRVALERLAREAVAAYGGIENPDGTTGWFAYRVFRQIQTGGVLRRALSEAGIGDDSLPDRVARDAFEDQLRRFREAVEAEVRQRMAEERGLEAALLANRRTLPEDVDFFRVSADEQLAMRRAVRVLARRLAARLAARRRRARHGRLDARRTMRKALATGGVPLDITLRRPPPHRPDLVLLCDVSGSVAAFARFTLMFVHALQGQFSRVRSFAFIDTVDEVTKLFADGDFASAAERLNSSAEVVWLDGHSDYGNAFATFAARWSDAVTPRTTVLVLGDARNNYRAPQTAVLADLRRKARKLYWLNPEPAAHWGSGDSIAPDYAAVVDDMVECRNLRQVAAFVESLV
jgi:uncharacterized protein